MIRLRKTLSLEDCCNFSLGVDCCNSLISRPALSLWTRGSQCRRETSISRLLHCCYSYYTGCYTAATTAATIKAASKTAATTANTILAATLAATTAATILATTTLAAAWYYTGPGATSTASLTTIAFAATIAIGSEQHCDYNKGQCRRGTSISRLLPSCFNYCKESWIVPHFTSYLATCLQEGEENL